MHKIAGKRAFSLVWVKMFFWTVLSKCLSGSRFAQFATKDHLKKWLRFLIAKLDKPCMFQPRPIKLTVANRTSVVATEHC